MEPIKVKFISRIRGGKYYTLDGVSELQSKIYTKGITTIHELCEEEQLQLLKDNEKLYDLKDQLQSIAYKI